MHLLLASKSPRRRELLAQLGIPFSVVNVDVMAISWLCYVNIRHKSLIINTPLFWEQMWCSQIVPTALTGKRSVKVVSTKVPNFVQIR